MRQIKNLNIERSIREEKLIFDESWSDKFNRVTIYVVFSPFIFLPIIMFMNERFISPNDRFILWILPISILIGLYTFYRNATEKHLMKIGTNLDKQPIREMLLNYADKQQFEIYRKSNDCLIFNEFFSYWGPKYAKTRIFIIKDNTILFAVLRDNFRLNLPTFFTHLFLKRGLTKLVKQDNT